MIDFAATFGDLVGVQGTMEKRFLALVLSLSLHLAVGTPANGSTEPFTAATNRSTYAGELSDVGRNKASSSSYSSESLSPSQRNTLLWPAAEAHTAAAAAGGGSAGKLSRGASATLGSPPLSLWESSVSWVLGLESESRGRNGFFYIYILMLLFVS